MNSRPRVHEALFVAVALSLALAAQVHAYAGQVPANVTITGPTGTIACGEPYQFQATIFEANGNRVTVEPVTWVIVSAPVGADDTITGSSTTDDNGVATTTARFDGAAGQRTIRATAGTAFGQIVVDPSDCGTPIPIPVRIGTCASALGLTDTGPFSPSTKVQEPGEYISFRLSFGPDFAGRLVLVTRALRGVPFAGWSDFLGGTLRLANDDGDVVYRFRSATPAWISVRGAVLPFGGEGAAITRACQGRWR